MATNYFEIWAKMPQNKWSTAKELGYAPATMTAMMRRNMVEATDTSPKQYKRIITPNTVLEMLLFYMPTEFVGVYNSDKEIGMLCSVKNGKLFDCWGESFDISSAAKVRFGKRYFSLSTGKEIV